MQTRQNERVDVNEVPSVTTVVTPSKVVGIGLDSSDTKHTTARTASPAGGPDSVPNVTVNDPGFDSRILPLTTQAKHTTGSNGPGAGGSQDKTLPGHNGLGGLEQ